MENNNQLSGFISDQDLASESLSGNLSQRNNQLSGNITIEPETGLSGSLSSAKSSLKGTLNTQNNGLNGMLTVGAVVGGTDNYNDLINLPSINHVTLIGDHTGKQLKLIDEIDYITSTEITALVGW